MMNNLFKTFGYCVIPKNSILFRGFKGNAFDDCMFFGTKYFVAKGFDNNVQVWQTKKSLKIVFMVTHLNNRGWVISGLPKLYKRIFPEENSKKNNRS